MADVAHRHHFVAILIGHEETLAIRLLALLHHREDRLQAGVGGAQVTDAVERGSQLLFVDGFQQISDAIVAEHLKRVFVVGSGEDEHRRATQFAQGVEAKSVGKPYVGKDDVRCLAALMLAS